MSEKHQGGYLPWDRTGNRLLIQSSLGKNKPTNYNIPDEQFVYGKLTPLDPEKTTSVMYEWNYFKNSQNKNINKTKDLVETNRKAIKSLLHTAHQNYDFRKTQTQYKKVKQGSQAIKISLPEQGFTYGKPGQLQDPIKLLVANDYGECDKILRHTLYSTKISQDSQPKRRLSCHITKNHNMKKQSTAKKMAQFECIRQTGQSVLNNQWKLSKFTAQALAKVDHTRKRRVNKSGQYTANTKSGQYTTNARSGQQTAKQHSNLGDPLLQ